MSNLALVQPRSIEGKLPPASYDAEDAVLASCIIDPRLIPRVSAILRAEHFASGMSSHLWSAILALHEAGKAVDVVAVCEYLRDHGRLVEVKGGMSGLIDLVNGPTVDLRRTVDHAHVIYDKWRVREAIRICQYAEAKGYLDYGDAQTYLDDLRRAVGRIADAGLTYEVESNLDVLKRLVREINTRAQRSASSEDGVTGLATGLRPYDRLTAGLHSGHVTVIGARPGVGKTALLGQWASNIAASGVGVGFVSLEMSRDELVERLVCGRGALDTARVRSALFTQAEWSRFHEAAASVAKWPLWFDDRPRRNIRQIRESAFAFLEQSRAAKVPLGVLFIDYLQYIVAVPEMARAPLKDAIAYTSAELKALARQLGIPIVVAAALNRDVDKAGKVRLPRKSDLRDCGAIESDADQLVFLHRASRMVEDREEFIDDGEALLLLDKQRGGESGRLVKLWFEGKHARFSERLDGQERPR